MRAHLPGVIVALAALHGLALVAEAVAPYAPDEQCRDLGYAPPTRLHIVDAEGRWHARPFVYAFVPDVAAGVRGYREDRRRTFPLRAFPSGARYTVLGLVEGRWHLFGVDRPARVFLLGADRYGRDVLSRLLVGARLSLFAGLVAAVLALGIGVAIGGAAGYCGGRVDVVLTWLAGVCLSLPWIYLLLAVRSVLPLDLPTGRAFLVTSLLIGVVGWARSAFLVRAVVAGERDRDYVVAARSLGASDLRLLGRHILPQAAGVIATQAAILAPRFVLAEVTLSFLGLGVGEPTPSWGTMTAALIPPGLVLSHWWLAAPLPAVAGVFALYDRAARDLERLPHLAGSRRLSMEGQ